jgi:CRP/FNR family transcriptional regulator, nitrogen fixation regulation protein
MHSGREVCGAGGRGEPGPGLLDAPAALEQLGTTVPVDRDQEIHRQGARADYCYRVLSGCVRKLELMPDGRRYVSGFPFAGDFIGLHDRDVHAFTAEAVTDVVLRRYPRAKVEALAERDPALAQWLAAMCLYDLHAAYQRMVLLSRSTSTERVAAFILEMDRRMEASGRSMWHMPMSRSDVADHLGLTTETVSRVLTQLQRDGLVEVRRNAIELHDHPSLRALAGGRGSGRRDRAEAYA